MGRSPLDELAERWRALQEGAGENLGRLKRAAETFAAGLDAKRKEERHREVQGEGRLRSFDEQDEAKVAVEHRVAMKQVRRGSRQGAHPIAAMSNTSRRVAGDVGLKERVLQEITPRERLEASAVVGTRGEEVSCSRPACSLKALFSFVCTESGSGEPQFGRKNTSAVGRRQGWSLLILKVSLRSVFDRSPSRLMWTLLCKGRLIRSCEALITDSSLLRHFNQTE